MNWKEIQQTLSVEFDLELKVVETHTNAFWADLRRQLAKPGTALIRVVGLGSWQITPKRLFRQMALHLIVLRKLQSKRPIDPGVVDAARLNIPILWRLKQKLGWHLTSKKKSPKAYVQSLPPRKSSPDVSLPTDH